MRVTVRLFARLRDLAGAAEMSRDVQPGATIRAVWRELAGEFPELAAYERSISAALRLLEDGPVRAPHRGDFHRRAGAGRLD